MLRRALVEMSESSASRMHPGDWVDGADWSDWAPPEPGVQAQWRACPASKLGVPVARKTRGEGIAGEASRCVEVEREVCCGCVCPLSKRRRMSIMTKPRRAAK